MSWGWNEKEGSCVRCVRLDRMVNSFDHFSAAKVIFSTLIIESSQLHGSQAGNPFVPRQVSTWWKPLSESSC